MTSNTTHSSGTFWTLLQVAFIVLKLCKVINWSWWWVLAPTWGSFALVFAILVLYGLGGLVWMLLPRRRATGRRR